MTVTQNVQAYRDGQTGSKQKMMAEARWQEANYSLALWQHQNRKAGLCQSELDKLPNPVTAVLNWEKLTGSTPPQNVGIFHLTNKKTQPSALHMND